MGNETGMHPDFFPGLIETYFANCEVTGEMPDPAGLILALGMSSRTEFEDARKDATTARVLDQACLRMASQWYQLLTKNKKDVNTLGVTYALRTMGFHDNFKAQESTANKDTLNLNFGEKDRHL